MLCDNFFFLAFHALIIFSQSMASRASAVVWCCEIQADTLEFSNVFPTISAEILGMSEHICTGSRERECVHVEH